LRLLQGAAAAQALAGLGRCGLSDTDVTHHLESAHLNADPAMLVGCLLQLLRESTEGTRGAGKPTLAALNQNHKLRLEVIKLIAGVADTSPCGDSAHAVSHSMDLLLTDQQAGEMRKIAGRRVKRSPR